MQAIFDGDEYALNPRESKREEWFVVSESQLVHLPDINCEQDYWQLTPEVREIVDQVAEELTPEEIARRIAKVDPFFRLQ